MISRVLLKIKQECVPLLILIAPVWSTMGPRTLKPLCQGTSAATPGTRNSDSPKNIVHSVTVENSLTLAAWVGFRKILFCEGISENASHIITNSRRKDTLSSYESAWSENELAGAVILFRDL